MRARVCACAPHFAEVSKMAQDATGAKEHKHQGDRRTQEHKRPPQEHQSRSQGKEPERNHRSESATRASAPAQAPEHARIKRNYKNNSKLIFF